MKSKEKRQIEIRESPSFGEIKERRKDAMSIDDNRTSSISGKEVPKES